MLIRHPATRRSGLSLVEVLVGLGLLGIAATSVIALFPFSALTLGQAMRDDRTTTLALVADGQIRDTHQHKVVELGDAGAIEPYHQAMDNPALGLGPGAVWAPGVARSVLPSSTEPSFPCFVDPMGYVAGRQGVGDNGETNIPRVNLSVIQNSPDPRQLALRYCSLMDSLSYDDDGRVPGGFDMRELRYNHCWVLQRPVNRDRFTVRLQVVVFNQRAHMYRPPGAEAVFFNAVFTPGETFIRNVPATADIRKGGWVMDGTIGLDPQGRQLRHAEFYRVVAVVSAGNGTLSLEVHKPVARADGLINPPDTRVYQYGGVLVSMPGVADVFDRTPLTAATGIAP
jgi:hypothetical protein